MPELGEHDWPVKAGYHLYGPWMVYDKKTKYRVCVHPDCTATEKKDVSKA